MLRSTFFLLLTVLLLNTDSVFSQTIKLATSKGAWHPAPVQKLSYRKGTYYGYPLAQQKAMYANMARFMELIHQTSFLNPTRGYEIGVYASQCIGGCNRGGAISGESGFIIREYFTRGSTGKIELAGEGPALRVYFNDIATLVSRIAINDEEYFEEPQVIDDLQGFPVYTGGFVALTKSKKPLFTPVSVGRTLEISIAQKRRNVLETKKSFEKGSPYQLWLANKSATVKGFHEGLAYLAKSDPEKAKIAKLKFTRDLEKTDSTMKAQEEGILKDQQKMIERFEEDLLKEEQKLASLSIADREAPALSQNRRRMVVPNKEFYDPKLPVSAVQIVLIDFFRPRWGDAKRNSDASLAVQAIHQLSKEVNLKHFLSTLQ